MELKLYCNNCGVELSDSNQEICENCGSSITKNELVKETSQNPTVFRDVSNEKPEKQRRRHRCC